MRQRPPFRRGQKLADPKHHVAGVVSPFPRSPQVELFGEICGGLSGKRRIGRATAFSLLAVAGGAGQHTARRIALVIQPEPLGWRSGADGEGQPGIMKGNRLALIDAKCPGDPTHLRMVAAPVRIGFKLALEIAGVEPREPRRARPIAATVQPVAGEAGVAGPRPGTAHRNDPAIFGKAVQRGRSGLRTTAKRRDGDESEVAHLIATRCRSHLFRRAAIAPALLLILGCKPPPDERQFMPTADAARGKAVIERVGCGSCHTVPGVGWPQGKVGPPLDGLARRALIAGRLPNRPDILAAYIRNAPALVPGSGMPAMPLTDDEARNVAFYLYEQGAR